MSERAKAHPAYTTDWEDEIVNVLHELNNAAFDEVSGDGQSSDLLRKEVSLAKIDWEKNNPV